MNRDISFIAGVYSGDNSKEEIYNEKSEGEEGRGSKERHADRDGRYCGMRPLNISSPSVRTVTCEFSLCMSIHTRTFLPATVFIAHLLDFLKNISVPLKRGCKSIIVSTKRPWAVNGDCNNYGQKETGEDYSVYHPHHLSCHPIMHVLSACSPRSTWPCRPTETSPCQAGPTFTPSSPKEFLDCCRFSLGMVIITWYCMITMSEQITKEEVNKGKTNQHFEAGLDDPAYVVFQNSGLALGTCGCGLNAVNDYIIGFIQDIDDLPDTSQHKRPMKSSCYSGPLGNCFVIGV